MYVGVCWPEEEEGREGATQNKNRHMSTHCRQHTCGAVRTHIHMSHTRTQHATELCVAVSAAFAWVCAVGRKRPRASLEDACVMSASQQDGLATPHALFFFFTGHFGGETQQNASASRLQPMTGPIKPWCPVSCGEIAHSLSHRNTSEKFSKVAGLRVFPQGHPSSQARYGTCNWTFDHIQDEGP